MSKKITVTATISAGNNKVWDYFTKPDHITKWNAANDEWWCPRAENDLKKGGRFTSRMEAKDGSLGFDFGGVYDEIIEKKKITYTMDDGRQATTSFSPSENTTIVTTVFDAETENPVELQQAGWQAILDNFKKYTETN